MSQLPIEPASVKVLHPPRQSKPTPAATVYAIHELRQRILQLLKPNDLASFMRVESGCMEAVAAELYHTRAYAEAMNMGTDTERDRMYLAAVKAVHTRNHIFGPEQVQQFKLKGYVPEYHADWLGVYQPTFFDTFVTPLRVKYPGLRRVEFGPDPKRWSSRHNSWWTLDFTGPTSGHFTVLTTKSLYQSKPPSNDPFGIHIPTLPSPDYTAHARFNLSLETLYTKQPRDGWATAFADDPSLGNLHHTVSFGDYPLTFELLSSLVQRQQAAGHTDRLKHISCQKLLPWSLESFKSFGRIAAPCLTHLDLSRTFNDPDTLDNAECTDIAALICAIGEILPNLTELRLPIVANENVEEECGRLLNEDTLESIGKIQSVAIDIHGLDEAPLEDGMSFFNMIRCFSPLVSPDGSIGVGLRDMDQSCSKDQKGFIRYLRAQPRNRRVHLATMSFPAIGYRTIYDDLGAIYSMRYHEGGRPMHRVEAEMADWASKADACRGDFAGRSDLDILATSFKDLALKSAEIDNASDGTDHPSTVKGLRKLLQSVDDVRKARVAAVEMLAVWERPMADMAKEIRRSIKRMEAAQKGER